MTTLIQHLAMTSRRNAATVAKPTVREQIEAAAAQRDYEQDRRYQRMECQLDECDRVLKKLAPSR